MEPAQLAKTARASLAEALGALQSADDAPDELLEAAEPIAKTMGILHKIERSNGAVLDGRDVALKNVRKVLADVQALDVDHPAVDTVLEAVAASLAKVNALAKYKGTGAPAPQPVAEAKPAAPAPAPEPVAEAKPAPLPAPEPLAPPKAAPLPATETLAQPKAAPLPATETLAQAKPAPLPAPQPVVSEARLAPIPSPEPLAPPKAATLPATEPLAPPKAAPLPAPEPVEIIKPAPVLQIVPEPAPAPQPVAEIKPAPILAPQPVVEVKATPAPQPVAEIKPAPAPTPAPAPAKAKEPAPTPAPAKAEPRTQPTPAPARATPAPAKVKEHAPPPGTRAVDVELGTHSSSNFYKGLSGNDVIEHGGIFVSTYRIPKLGAEVQLRVLLPGDYEFYAKAIVQWTREASGSSEPGFGARFTQIGNEGRQLVYRYARNREPMFYDDL
ncbi:hypothetical protein [Polyangium sp. y55x31]|uniref:hypothetical protein n=1 Tax=Polyangium sp. y55x31 TaxID=3042688 RepID=UPI002482B650|nr:hypothetical protein [Polyangium sp. y55x31]MDI1482587.1 hypothetical protein [Polyangium sp. y55x31]